jgi:hypothetical protein
MNRKVISLVLTLLIVSVASVNAQVRIGGSDDPNPSAVLDLNEDNTTNDGKLGLALPRVALTSTSSYAPLKEHVAGMTVYNTATANDVTPGTYYNDGSKWVRIGSGTLTLDGVIGNAITDATSGWGLIRAGEGTTEKPYTLGIADNGVTSAKVADEAVTAAKLSKTGVTKGQAFVYNGTNWMPASVTLPCSGAIVFEGAYSARDTLITGFDGNFAAGWRSAAFSTLGDLCWAPTNSSTGNWVAAKAACAALTTDNARWRLPNLRELQVLYEAIGGAGSAAVSFANLNSKGTGIANGAANMQPDTYWSSTEYSSDNAYAFDFYNGYRPANHKTNVSGYVRCVRSL